jgi:hypothetical protein
MGSSSSKISSSSPKILGSEILATIIAPIWNAISKAGRIQYTQDVNLREELEVIKKSMAELTQERDKARDEIREKSDALAAVQREREALNGPMEEMTRKFKFLAEEIGTLNTQLGQAQGEMDDTKKQLDRREMEMRIANTELEHIKVKHSQTTALLETRTAELKGAQAFLTKADSTAGADVVRMVEGLDAEILQTAAFMADHFVFEEKQNMTDEVQEAVNRIAELLGPKIVDLLGTTEHANDPTLIQLACQATTIAFCRWTILSWDFDEPDYDQFLQHIYMTVQQAGELTVVCWDSVAAC